MGTGWLSEHVVIRQQHPPVKCLAHPVDATAHPRTQQRVGRERACLLLLAARVHGLQPRHNALQQYAEERVWEGGLVRHALQRRQHSQRAALLHLQRGWENGGPAAS